MAKFTKSVILLVCVLFSLMLQANAASMGVKDGLNITITTDRTSYTTEQDIRFSLNIENTNPFKVEDISVATMLPEDFVLRSGDLSEMDIDIEPGMSYSVTAVAQLLKNTDGTEELAPDIAVDSGEGDQKVHAPFARSACFAFGLVVLPAVIVVAILLIRKSRQAARVMSLLLCIAMALTILPEGVLAAENDTSSMEVIKTVIIDGKEYQITSTVSYTPIAESVPSAEEQVVPQQIAELFGISSEEYDSDNDGLSNYFEIFNIGTNPALADTDDNGKADGEEDADGDGLANAVELEKGTDLTKADTDGDGISDLEEISQRKTDPCNCDTDGDGLTDGDELVLNLNPLEKMTDGITLDSERKFTQSLNAENFDEQLLSEDNEAIPSLTLTTTGNVNKRVFVTATNSNDFSDSRAVVGEPIDISGENLGEGIVSFSQVNAGSTVTVGSSEEIVHTNVICKYSKDGTTEYLDTTYNPEENTVSAGINGEGTYFVLNVEGVFNELGLTMPGGTMTRSARSASANTRRATSRTAMAQADIVFLIDSTGSMDDEINNVRENIDFFIDALKVQGISAGLALIDYQDIGIDGHASTQVHKCGTSNWFYNLDDYKYELSNLELGYGGDAPECVVDALETGRLLDMRASAGKIFVLVTDADYKVDNRYGIPSMGEEIKLLKNAGVTCAVISTPYDIETYYDLYMETNGVWGNIRGDFYSELMTLADKIGRDMVGDGYWIYLDGPVPVPVRLDAKPALGSTVDTDKDGIYDIYELEGIEPTGSLDLDALLTQISQGTITGTDYGTVMMYRYTSNPIEPDTDFDGTADPEDTMPRSNQFTGIMHYEIEGQTNSCNVDFSMDYRDLIEGNNEVYSKELSKLSILYASDVYDKLYIEFTGGASGGNDTATTFGSILGLQDVKDYHIIPDNYAVDKDDVTEFVAGHRRIVYNGIITEVLVVSVRGTNGTNAEWSSNFDVGADTIEYYEAMGYQHPDWRNKENHKGFDVAANRVYDKLWEYICTFLDSRAQTSVLITGHSRGAAIANILGQMFSDDTSFKTYAYTFATPNSTTSVNAGNYRNIFNIINEDDLIPYLPLSAWNFKNYGITKSISVNEYYEQKWLGGEVGTFEWLIGTDYNDDGGTARTLDCFGALAGCREDIYVLDTTADGKVWENNVGHVTRSGAEKELVELTATLEAEKLLRFCNLYVVGGGISYHVEINYCPAYFMQTLSNITTGVGPLLGRDVKGKYNTALVSFVASSGKVVVGGMAHPHMQPTYYLLARNNVEPLG